MRQKNRSKWIKATMLKVALATCITAIVIVACRKVSTNESLGTTEFNAAAAKEWYYGSFKKTAEYTNSTVAMGKRLPVWKQGITYKIGNIQFVEFPLAEEKKQRDLPQELTTAERLRVFSATLDKVVFGKLPNGKVVTRIVRFAPTLAYLQSKGYDISSNTFNKMDHNFSGNLYVYRWNGTLVKGLVFENGTSRKTIARTSKTRPVIGKGNTTAPNDESHTIDGEESGGEGDPICDYHVIYHYTQTCYVTFEGDVMGVECDDPVLEYVEYEEYNCHEATELPCSGENLTQECLCENYGFCGDDGEGGDNTTPPYMTVEVQDNLNDPCLKSAKNKITDNSCSTFLTSLFQSSFVGQGSTANIWFHEGGCLSATGNPPGCTLYDASTNTYGITLNPYELSSSSQEYVGTVILHEIVHAFIQEQNPNLGNDLNDASHRIMIGSWIDSMSLLLQQCFGISAADATALALYGTGKALYGDGVASPAQWDNFIQSKYGVTASQVNTIGTDYKSKTNGKGTTCQ